jgi:serine/threonine protein kinase
MAETPTLLPNLKFHDLVFGHDLGEGAFGTVRYARLIDRSRTRSQWAEYAVKIISTEKIKEMGYETSVQRELAVLRVLSHPGIARLVSSFRFREGVYLVLEYASGGDLHSLLKKNGSLDHDSTRFVIGEVVAALSSIHDMGLVYADLKPENIVITEFGHIKLTDFGGSRPVTEEANTMIGMSATNLLKELRDGDWKPQPRKKADTFDMDEELQEVEVEAEEPSYDPNDDTRIEGTTAYLPPEVVMGGFPTPAADSWALGCVLYQCLLGRPPILEADKTLTKKLNRLV